MQWVSKKRCCPPLLSPLGPAEHFNLRGNLTGGGGRNMSPRTAQWRPTSPAAAISEKISANNGFVRQ